MAKGSLPSWESGETEYHLWRATQGRDSQGSKHLTLLNQADFHLFCFCGAPLLPIPKMSDNVASTVAPCLIHGLSYTSHKNMVENPIAAIMNALFPHLKSRALSQIGWILFFLGEESVKITYFLQK